MNDLAVALENPLLQPGVFTELTRDRFNEVNPALIYLKRLPIVKADEIEILSFGPVPNIKNGALIRESMQKRIVQNSVSGEEYDLVLAWRNNMVQRLVDGIHQRMNILACEA